MSETVIESRDNRQFKRLRSLAHSSRERRKEGKALLDGVHLIEAYCTCVGAPELLAVAQGALTNPEVQALRQRAASAHQLVLNDALFDDVAPVATPVGIVAVIPTPRAPKLQIGADDWVLLEDIQDPGNLGSILRSTAAAGVRHVALSTGCVFAWSPKTLRAAMGAHFQLEIHERVDLVEFLRAYPGISLATELSGPASIHAVSLPHPVAWLFGNEGAGLRPDTAAGATTRVSIPMVAATESLNVAAAAAICLFETRRWRAAHRVDASSLSANAAQG